MEEAKGNIRTVATAQDPTLVRCFRGHEKTLTSVVFSHDMKQVVSSGQDGLVQVWSFKPQVRPFKFIGHTGTVNDVIFNKDSTKIISCGDDRQIRFWKNSVQGKYTSVKAHSGPILKLSLADNFLLSCSSDKTVKMWSLQGKFKQSYLSHTNWVRQVEVANDQRIMLSCSDDRTLKIWDLEQSKVVTTFSDHKSGVLTCKFSPDATCIAGGSKDGSIKLWDTRTNKLIQHYNAHNSAVNRIAFHPYGYNLSSVSDDGKIKIWSLKQGRLGWTLLGHTGEIKTVSFNDKGDYFATGAEDSLLMIWRSNFDESLIIPARIKETNYIEKQGNSLQPLFISNKIIDSENLHKKESFTQPKQKEEPQQENIKTANKNKNDMLQIMSSGLEKLVNQLDYVTRVVTGLDQKISKHQKTIQSMFEHQKVADYLAILEDTDRLVPPTYNSVWQAFENLNKNKKQDKKREVRQQEFHIEINDIEDDLDKFNNLSNKKLAYEEMEARLQQQFKQKLQQQQVEFREDELERGGQRQRQQPEF